MRTSYFLLAVLLFAGRGASAAVLPGETEVLALFAGLAERFVVEGIEEVGPSRVYRLRSADPSERGTAGPLYSRASLTISTARDGGNAEAEIERRLAEADPDVGLSYAWDLVTAADDQLVHLHADCTFSEKSFLELARAVLRTATAQSVVYPKSFWCRCGGGCRSGAPVSPEPRELRALPRVKRAADDEDDDEEYDNRLDPSGAWTGRGGELALMHYADGLSFSYLSAFGPTAHICEGAGVAGLVGTDRYEYEDEQGTVAFVITENDVRLEVVDGIASFCGAGWAGDRFTTEGFEPPGECTVTAARSHFHVTDTVDRERRPAYVVRGDRVEVAPARHTGDEEWLLARFVGEQTTEVGLLARGDLECPAAAAEGAGR